MPELMRERHCERCVLLRRRLLHLLLHRLHFCRRCRGRCCRRLHVYLELHLHLRLYFHFHLYLIDHPRWRHAGVIVGCYPALLLRGCGSHCGGDRVSAEAERRYISVLRRGVRAALSLFHGLDPLNIRPSLRRASAAASPAAAAAATTAACRRRRELWWHETD